MNKWIGYMNFGIKHVLNLIMALLVTVVFLQVIFRFVLNSPLAWTEELARYSLIWLTFLGAAYAMSSKAHIGMEFFVKLFAVPVRKALYSIATFASLLFFLLMVVEGYDLAMQGMSQTSPVLRIPMGVIYMVIPVSGAILIINMASQFSKDFKSGGV
ncbi:Tripartite ATP-independent periplasmic transporter DctQ component [Planococcus donghaensis MPA1U2]|uniref:Tripartite ATP-independent periplasmic transporter DctQ component n=1 Tax=Planococcus donghaensis MPA1U2 TaxID=933115 RepID=E7RI95_9BACL|nr:TRAP transporter small permease [Planococcus donghaensis]EGA89270.1 Tripartite ATP-independent periplasmic transporter DctQ component [Planococcus donghaensis MPA1U2]